VFGSSHQFIYEYVDCVEEVPGLQTRWAANPASKVRRSLAAQMRFRSRGKPGAQISGSGKNRGAMWTTPAGKPYPASRIVN